MARSQRGLPWGLGETGGGAMGVPTIPGHPPPGYRTIPRKDRASLWRWGGESAPSQAHDFARNLLHQILERHPPHGLFHGPHHGPAPPLAPQME